MISELAYITITHSVSGLQGTNYGPFLNKKLAQDHLKDSGWTERTDIPDSYWYAQTSKHEGMNAVIKTLSLHEAKSFPISMREKALTVLTAG